MPPDINPLNIGTLVRARGDRWTIVAITSHGDCSALRLSGCGSTNAGQAKVLLLPFDRLQPIQGDPRVRVEGRRAWGHHVRAALLAAHPFGGLRAVAQARADLLPFQLEPALAMMRHGRHRILIADEVGLGKTIQAGMLLNELAAQGDDFRSLIVTPAGIRQQWQSELASRFSRESTLADTRWLLASAANLPPDVNPWSLPGIFVTSFDLVKRPEVLRALEDVTWDVVVIDEAHGAGPGTARLAAAQAIGARARRIVLLTATPPDGDPAHMAALAAIGAGPGEPPMTVFRRTRQDAGIQSRRKSIVLAVHLSQPERRMHRLLERYTSLVWREAGARQDSRARLAAVILRKRALSSARSLALSVRRRLDLLSMPPLALEHQLLLPLGDEGEPDDRPPDSVIGAAGLADVGRERVCLEQIAEAAEQAALRESKLAALTRLLTRIHEPALVFTEYRDTLAQIAAALPATCAPLVLHGDLTPGERSVVQRVFTAKGSVLLATDAASEGLNLHERCRLVVHFELPWTPTRLEQRTGRVDRLGQSGTVHEIVLVARDTAERLVLAPLVTRIRVAASQGNRSAFALSESSVAAALMDGTSPVADLPKANVSDASLDLRSEAMDEAKRLTMHRRLRATGSQPIRRSHDGICVWTRATPSSRLLVIGSVVLSNGVGNLVHSELVPLLVTVRPAPLGRRRSTAAAWAATFMERHLTLILETLRRHSATTCEETLTRWRRHTAAAAARERVLAAGLPSSAQPLVQAGLFDRRAMARAKLRRSAVELLTSAIGSRIAILDASAAVKTHLRVIAIGPAEAGRR